LTRDWWWHDVAVKIIDLDAAELSSAIHHRSVSCREVMTAYLDRIDERNGALNAIVSLRDRDELLTEARKCDDELSRGTSRGWMHGFPHAVKDLAETKGLLTTKGSPILANNVPDHDALQVARIREAGAIIIGKTNVPEFGLGSNTFNPVFGSTANPYDVTKVAGGSSGGAAVALATRMVPVADGSDFMGSLRNPAGWCNVVGYRPSFGRVPAYPSTDSYSTLCATEGPMGRKVIDVAMLLGTQAGWDSRVPTSLPGSLTEFSSFASCASHLAGTMNGARIGWLGDLGGHLPTEAGMLEICESALRRMTADGAEIETVDLNVDLDALWLSWLHNRHAYNAATYGPLLSRDSLAEQLKPEVRWEAESGMVLSALDLKRAATVRTSFYERISSMFRSGGGTFDLLALPTAQVWPFDIEMRWPHEVAGRAMDTYHRWMECTIYATYAGLPAISMPAGFSPCGRPAGIQLIGSPLNDVSVLRYAAAYERLIDDFNVGQA
jgi:amidase